MNQEDDEQIQSGNAHPSAKFQRTHNFEEPAHAEQSHTLQRGHLQHTEVRPVTDGEGSRGTDQLELTRRVVVTVDVIDQRHPFH